MDSFIKKITVLVFLSLLTPPLIVPIMVSLAGLYTINELIFDIILTPQFWIFSGLVWVGVPVWINLRLRAIALNIQNSEYEKALVSYVSIQRIYFSIGIIYGLVAGLIVLVSGFSHKIVAIQCVQTVFYLGAANMPFYLKFIELFDEFYKNIPLASGGFTRLSVKLKWISVSSAISGIGVIAISAMVLVWRMLYDPAFNIDFESLIWRLCVLSTIFIIIQAMPNFFIGRSIEKSISRIRDFTVKMGKKDLTHKLMLENRDEIGDIAFQLNKTNAIFREIISEIHRNSDFLKDSGKDLKKIADNFLNASEEQAANAEELAVSVEQMSANMNVARENASYSEKISLDATKNMEEGKQSLERTMVNFEEIIDKVKIVEEIASHTNLLAINAFVEAANARQFGKGFAVIAREVRELAEKTRFSAIEIDQFAKICTEASFHLNEKLQDVSIQLSESSSKAIDIAAAANEQQTTGSQINDSVQRLNNSAQQLANSSHKISSASENMIGWSGKLNKTINMFTYEVN